MKSKPRPISQNQKTTIVTTGQKYKNYKAANGDYNKGSLGSYVLEGDLPKELSSEVLKQTSLEYVPFLRENNNLFNEVFNALMTSPTNAAIIQKKVWLINGDSLSIIPKQGVVLRNDTPPTDNNIIAFDSYLSNVNEQGETINDVLYKASFDFATFGNAYIKIVKSQKGSVKRMYQSHIPFSWVRLQKVNRANNEINPTHVGVSPYWDTQSGRQQPDNLRNYPIYPNFERDETTGVEFSVLHIKNHYPHFNYYGIPSYVAAMLHCELEYRIAKYNQSQFDNGFMPSAFMQIFGAATEEEAHEAMLSIEEKYQGTGNNSKLILQFLSDPDKAAKIDVLQDIKEGSWLELGQIARENIITAHSWSQSFSGLSTAGSLGSNQQIKAEFELIQNTVIQPMQRQILEQWINKVLPQVAEFENLDFGNNEVAILNNSPISFAGDIPVSVVLTTDEQRAQLGFEPLNNGGNDANTN